MTYAEGEKALRELLHAGRIDYLDYMLALNRLLVAQHAQKVPAGQEALRAQDRREVEALIAEVMHGKTKE